jgi:hypothetical protein
MTPRARRCAAAAIALVMALHPIAQVRANSREAEVKAAYIDKLAAFVSWPQGALSSAAYAATLCVEGRPDILESLTRLVKGQRLDDRPLVAMALPPHAQTASGCQVLYLGEGGKAEHQLVQSLGNAPVLTISDRDAGSDGGVIELVDHGDTVRLVVHRGEASRRGLILSSKLLVVAEGVEP